MLNMENAEEVMQILERFTRLKQKEIPKELDDYMHYVAKTGDTVFKWSSLKYLFREKLLNVIKNFHDTSPRVDDLPQYPNVDPFNYESMKSSLLERLELFNAAPFTVQRLCELLTEPRKQYSRIDKFMRALEKNILVSTIEPGRKQTESENGDSLDSVVNGDVSLDVNVDIEMENETVFNAADASTNATPSESTPAQPSPNLIHKADDDILPNPKKVKLDLDENNDAEIEAATKSITSNKSESIPSVEISMAAETTVVTEKKPTQEPVREDKSAPIESLAEKENNVAQSEKMEEDQQTSTATTNDQAKSDKQPEEKDVTPIPASTVQVAQVVSEESKTGAEKDNNGVCDVKKVDKEVKDEKDEKIIEKVNEVEKEKINKPEDQNGDVKPSELKTETNITTIETTNEKKSEIATEENKEKSDKTSEKSVIIESSVTTSVIESQAETSPVTQEEAKDGNIEINETMTASEEKSSSVEKTKETVNEKSIVMEVDTSIQVKTAAIESPQNDDITKSEEVKEKETEKPKIADSLAVESPAAEVVAEATAEKIVDASSLVEVSPAEAIAEKTKEDTAQVAKDDNEKVSIDKSQAEKAENENTKIEKPTAEKAEINVSDVKTPIAEATVVATNSNDSSATESAETKPEIVTPTTLTTPAETVLSTTPTVVQVPTISAEPMEENPESIAEAEPVVPAIVEAATTVEEVVMAGDSVEMATDATEPAKDEPAGMEVDDTSQEAMDQ